MLFAKKNESAIHLLQDDLDACSNSSLIIFAVSPLSPQICVWTEPEKVKLHVICARIMYKLTHVLRILEAILSQHVEMCQSSCAKTHYVLDRTICIHFTI